MCHGEEQRFIVWQATNPDSNIRYCWWFVYCLKEAQRQWQDQLKLQFRNTVVRQHYAFVMCIFCGPDHNTQPQLVLPVVHWIVHCCTFFEKEKMQCSLTIKNVLFYLNKLKRLTFRPSMAFFFPFIDFLKYIIYILGLLFYCCTLCRYSKPKQLRCAIFCMASKKNVLPCKMVISFWRSVCNISWAKESIFVTADLSAQLCPVRNMFYSNLYVLHLY